MNYYPFHIGDYLSATRHLSWEEDAAFRRLLDTYYTTEKPLTLDHRAVCRLVLATTDSQREAVRVVLEEFFEQTPEGWINRRADAEIETMREKRAKQRAKANKRWGKPSAELGNAADMLRHEEPNAAASKTDADAMPPTPTPTPTKKKEQPPQAAASAFEPPEWIDRAAWDGYVEMRKRKRAAPTKRACELVVAALDRMRSEGHNPNAALDQSTRNAWTDVYPLKPGNDHANSGSGRSLSPAERVARVNAEAERRSTGAIEGEFALVR